MASSVVVIRFILICCGENSLFPSSIAAKIRSAFVFPIPETVVNSFSVIWGSCEKENFFSIAIANDSALCRIVPVLMSIANRVSICYIFFSFCY